VKASVALQRARALVRAPHTAFLSLCRSQGLDPARECEAVGYDLLYLATFEAEEDTRDHFTVENQRATYDIAISLALSDEAVGL
jgi:hypothetical protein